MKKIYVFLIAAGLFQLGTGCSKKIGQADQKVLTSESIKSLAAAPSTWQEHWFEHNQLLHLVFSDTSVAVYFDNDVNASITWPNTYLAQAWNYTKATYGAFGSDSRLWPIFHAGKYSGGHPSTYFDVSHDLRNVIDVGSSDPNAWTSGTGNDIDLTTHEIGHIVEGASKGVHNSPAFGIWHDSKWMEIYQYDVYLGLGRAADVTRWYNLKIPTTDNFPRAGTHWFRDWFYPVYNGFGKTAVLNNFFSLLAQYFPKHTVSNGTFSYPEYTRGMNFGEFVHFWSGAAGADLKQLALTAFGNLDESGNDWTNQLTQAKIDFPALKYTDITGQGTLSVTKENAAGAGSAEGSSKLVDNSYSTKFFVGGFPSGMEMQLSFPSTHIVGSYTLTSGNDAADRDPKSWQLLGSNNGTSWTVIDSRTGQSFDGRNQTKLFRTTNTTAFSRYKWYVSATNGSVDFQASEWRLIEYN
jgi:hypothetical protein